jgi:ketosteroid isomerase-like protein
MGLSKTLTRNCGVWLPATPLPITDDGPSTRDSCGKTATLPLDTGCTILTPLEFRKGDMRTFPSSSIRVFTVVAIMSCFTFAPTNLSANQDSRGAAHEADRAAITSVLTAQQDAWNQGDVDKFLVGYWHSPDLTFSGSSGIARGWDRVMARYKKNYPDQATMGHLDFSGLEFHFLGKDAALVLGRWHLKRDKGDVGGVFSLVWQRFPEGWRIVHDHTSADEPAK